MPYIRQRYLVAAFLLFTLGFLFLLNNFEVFKDADLSRVWLIWPLIMLLTGLYILIRGRKFAPFVTATTAIITGVVIFSLLSVATIKIPFLPTIDSSRKSNINPNIEITTDSEKTKDNIDRAALIFRSHRGNFTLRGTTDTLTEYESKSTFGEYRFTRAQKDGLETVDLRFDEERFPWKLTAETNSLDLKLNDKPKWDLDYEVETSSNLDLDLGYYRVEKLRVKTSSTSTNILFGEKSFDKEVRFELDTSAASSTTLRVPKNVGIEMKLSSNFSSASYPDLKKVEGETGLLRTENFESKEKKLYIDADISLSNLRIETY